MTETCDSVSPAGLSQACQPRHRSVFAKTTRTRPCKTRSVQCQIILLANASRTSKPCGSWCDSVWSLPPSDPWRGPSRSLPRRSTRRPTTRRRRRRRPARAQLLRDHRGHRRHPHPGARAHRVQGQEAPADHERRLAHGHQRRPGSGLASPVAANAALTADVSLKNPNAVAFRFSQSETDVYYKGQTVSVAYAPAGSVGADRTTRMNVTLDLLGDRLARAANGTGLVFGQEYDLDTYTAINGTVKVLGIVKKDVEIRLDCSIVIEVGGAAGALVSGVASTVQSKGVSCVADVSM